MDQIKIGWKPGEDICVIFDDKTAARRSTKTIMTLIEELTEVANRYNFDLCQLGTRQGFAQFFHRYYEENGNHKKLP